MHEILDLAILSNQRDAQETATATVASSPPPHASADPMSLLSAFSLPTLATLYAPTDSPPPIRTPSSPSAESADQQQQQQ
ncbi:hypothetical protein SprV_0301202700 [Sparganum proliferum]